MPKYDLLNLGNNDSWNFYAHVVDLWHSSRSCRWHMYTHTNFSVYFCGCSHMHKHFHSSRKQYSLKITSEVIGFKDKDAYFLRIIGTNLRRDRLLLSTLVPRSFTSFHHLHHTPRHFHTLRNWPMFQEGVDARAADEYNICVFLSLCKTTLWLFQILLVDMCIWETCFFPPLYDVEFLK